MTNLCWPAPKQHSIVEIGLINLVSGVGGKKRKKGGLIKKGGHNLIKS